MQANIENDTKRKLIEETGTLINNKDYASAILLINEIAAK